MVEVRTKFPPEEFTDDEWSAVVGRYVENPEAQPDPVGSGRQGLEVAAPHGVIFVRRETFEGAEQMVLPDEIEVDEVEDEDAVDLEEWTVAELKDALDQAGVDYPASARKAELIELLEENEV